ncbi:DUF3280 domain-containing protein [Roseivivax sediminis]|nr:DUF3280 domain-containing protein [Roseivivax sediminis]
MRYLITMLAALLGLAAPALAQQDWPELDRSAEVAFFGITYLDDSIQTEMQGADPAEAARIGMLEELVADRFAEEGWTLADTAPVQDQIDRVVNPAKCYGCDTRAAADLGAGYSLVGEVQKVSNLILSMNLQMRDAETGDMVRGRVVDIRSNTDESWQRGMNYILDNTFFEEEGE